MLPRSNVQVLRTGILGNNATIVRFGTTSWTRLVLGRSLVRAAPVARSPNRSYTRRTGEWTLGRCTRKYSTDSTPAANPAYDAVVSESSSYQEESSKAESESAESQSTTLTDENVPSETEASDVDPSFNRTPKAASKRKSRTSPLLEIAKAGPSPQFRNSDVVRNVSKKAVKMELQWLKDPRALANRVGRMLQTGKIAMAAELVREAQTKRMECTVAWNHLIEYAFMKGEPLAAFKFYNDMKKRGRRPNSRTYTMMLTGLSKAPPNAQLDITKTALSIYRSISQPQSIATPNVVHANAMLNVCRRTHSMQTLWQVAGSLPEDGPDAPNTTTYTIILDTIRLVSQSDVRRFSPNEFSKILKRKEQGIRDGKRIWADIVYLWVKGKLAIDSRLVTAMAKLLLDGASEGDCYDVFALYNQTSGIPIFADKPENDEIRSSKMQAASVRTAKEVEDVPFVGDDGKLLGLETAPEGSEGHNVEREEEQQEEENFEHLFDPVVPHDSTPKDEGSSGTNKQSTATYLKPENRDLSMILEACREATQTIGAGKAYWQHLTLEDHGYKIEPDAFSCHQYLRILRIGRSSRLTVELLRDQMAPTENIQGKSFHIAFSCCRRDIKNINVFNHANEILKLMEEALVLPDPRSLIDYLRLVDVLVDNPQSLMSLKGLDVELGSCTNDKLATVGRKLKTALQTAAVSNLLPHAHKLNAAMEQDKPSRNWSRKSEGEKIANGAVTGNDALNALIRTRGLIDEVLKEKSESLLPGNIRQLFQDETKQLRKYSRADLTVKFKDSLVVPTEPQREEFEEKRAAVLPGPAQGHGEQGEQGEQ